MPIFARHIGIDYSGAGQPTEALTGLRVYMAENSVSPLEVRPPGSGKINWTRKGIAEWLVARLSDGVPTLVGIDHGFSFPLRYFNTHNLPHNWHDFLEDFCRHWPTDQVSVKSVRDGLVGNGAARLGETRWRRLAEERAGGAKSVFHFGVPGAVAHSTHAGIPWLRFFRERLGSRVHVWPFDGWDTPTGRSVIAEVYPALWSGDFDNPGRTADQHDAFSVAAWLSQADQDGRLGALFAPRLSEDERSIAKVEGWILGLTEAGVHRRKSTPILPSKTTRPKPRSKLGPRKLPAAKTIRPTTVPGYTNKHGQTVQRKTDQLGNDHNQRIYVLSCKVCGFEYGANGSDIWLRRCPACQGGAAGLQY